MKIAVIGSRSFNNFKLLEDTLSSYESKITTIVSGGARGADSLAESWAEKYKKETIIIKPDWDKHGKSAGFIRNRDIIEACDGCIAFWDQES